MCLDKSRLGRQNFLKVPTSSSIFKGSQEHGTCLHGVFEKLPGNELTTLDLCSQPGAYYPDELHI